MKNRAFKIFALLALVLIVSTGVWVVESFREDEGAGARNLLQSIVSPLTRFTGWMSRKVSGGLEYLVISGQLREENRNYRDMIAQLRAENGYLRETLAEYERLNPGAVFAEIRGWDGIPADVMAWSGKPYPRSLVINKGTSDGVEMGDPVMYAEGLAGVVARASQWTSTIQLLNDTRTAVGVVVLEKRARGVVSGAGQDGLLQIILENPNISLKPGMRVASSGMENSLYPRGLPIGLIGQVHQNRFGESVYEVIPYVEFDQVQEVLVLKTRVKTATTDKPREE
ncbi:MAG: rod shape-determining protein MreC, partial [Candidatus Sumerlaeia bacterium]